MMTSAAESSPAATFRFKRALASRTRFAYSSARRCCCSAPTVADLPIRPPRNSWCVISRMQFPGGQGAAGAIVGARHALTSRVRPSRRPLSLVAPATSRPSPLKPRVPDESTLEPGDRPAKSGLFVGGMFSRPLARVGCHGEYSPSEMRSTKIVATIGPASRDPEVLERLIAAGVDVARLNFAHGDPSQHAETAAAVRAAAERVGRQVAILGDVPGPKLRIGPVAGGVAELGRGSTVVLTPSEVEGTAERLPVAWEGLAELMAEGDICYLADGAVRLRVDSVTNGEVLAKVEVGGVVASRQGLNLPNVTVSLPAVSEEDIALIDAGLDMGVDAFALSFVRRREDLEPVREHLRGRGSDAPLIAKVEKPQAAANAEEIVDAADGIMVARGDLGIELPIEEVPLVQKRLLHLAGLRSKPSITATQMLESMVGATRPTRAEVTDVANAIFDGTDAVMLSQETAVGRYPVEAIAMMSAIAETTERELPYDRWAWERSAKGGDESRTIASLAVQGVSQLDLKAVVCPTLSGRIARLISGHRPRVPVLALCHTMPVVRRCTLYWGVRGELFEEPAETTDLLEACGTAAKDFGVAKAGDKIGITAG